jgi:hypothetical protein
MGGSLPVRLFSRMGHLFPYPQLRGLWWIYRALPGLLGLVLLAAAALKTHEMATALNTDSDLLTSRWSVMGLIELELALGLCLLLQLYPRQTRIAALVTFTAFAAVSLQQALAGKASCSCFGAVPVRPWLTFFFDLAAVAGLGHWHPVPRVFSAWERTSISQHLLSMTLATLILSASYFAAKPWHHSSTRLLKVSPEAIDMGKIQAGGCKYVPFTVTNPSDVLVAIARIETSCGCLTIDLPANLIGLGQTVRCHARIDLATEAGFLGNLSVRANGLHESGAVLFTLGLDVEVQRG